MNKKELYMDSLKQFPITGKDVCNILLSVSNDMETCLVKDIETLCSSDCQELGNLWRRVNLTRAETMKISDLLSVLIYADQIVSLDIQSKINPHRVLLIDDGELVENTLDGKITHR